MKIGNHLKIQIIGILCLITTSCSLPSKWAETLEKKVKCDMSLQEVQELTVKKIIVEDTPNENRTHYIRDKNTDIWFVFKDNKLKTTRVLWAHKMMKYASYQEIQLCTNPKEYKM